MEWARQFLMLFASVFGVTLVFAFCCFVIDYALVKNKCWAKGEIARAFLLIPLILCFAVVGMIMFMSVVSQPFVFEHLIIALVFLAIGFGLGMRESGIRNQIESPKRKGDLGE